MESTATKQPYKTRLQLADEKRREQDGLSDYVFGKVQPQAIPLEEAVLGALMLDKSALTVVVDIIQVSTFYTNAHQLIYKAILRLYNRMHPVDLLTVTEELKRSGELDAIGGGFYLVEMTNRVGSSANIEYHARILVQKAIQRELIAMSSQVITDCYQDVTDVFTLVDDTQKNLMSIVNFSNEAECISSAIAQSLKRFEEWTKSDSTVIGTPSGLRLLDKVTNGWQPGKLICIAARPGMGKTSEALLNALAAAKNGDPVLIFTLEMSNVEISDRLISLVSNVSIDDVKKKHVTDADWQQLHYAVEYLSGLPIYIDDTPGLTLMEARAKSRRMAQRYGIKMVIIDYLQLMSGENNNSGKGNREQEISTISRGLKGLAKELHVPVIALSQLSRAVETRGGTKRPMLSDLRESGAIEQDCDIIVFIYRPEYYQILEDETGASLKGVAEIIIAKNRDGKLDTVKVAFIDRLAKFEDLNDSAIDFEEAMVISDTDPFAATFTPSKVMTVPSKKNDDEDIPF